MGQVPLVQNQKSSESPFGRPWNTQAEQIGHLEAALVTSESSPKNEVETLKTSCTRTLSSERQVRVSARSMGKDGKGCAGGYRCSKK